jgi:YHS domain
MVTSITRRSFLIALPIGSLAFPALAQNLAPNMTPNKTEVPRLAIGGYDTVAYHTVGKAVPGTLDYQVAWHDARWQFASKKNLDLFTQNPEKYAAQYDGHCAMGVAGSPPGYPIVFDGHKDTVDPEAFTVVNGKLYLNHTKYWTTEWRKDAAANISRADKNWVTIKDMPEPCGLPNANC